MTTNIVNTSREREEKLIEWLHRLVEILRFQGGSTWNALARNVTDKTAIIELDDTRLRLRASGRDRVNVEIELEPESLAVNFRSTAETLREIIRGELLLDHAVSSGEIYLRGDLQDLLGIYEIVMGILGDSAINPQLQNLWNEFEHTWQSAIYPVPCRSLEPQKPTYGYLISQVPEDVLLTQIVHILPSM